MNREKTILFNILYSILVLIGCVVIGKILAHFIPALPSSLYGLIIFTLALHFRLFDAEKIKATATWCIRHMAICFVPAGVGIMNHFDLIKQHGIAIVAITFTTTFLLLTAVGLLYQRHEKIK